MNTQQTRKPSFLARLLTVRFLCSAVVVSAILTSASLSAQVRPSPDTNPVPPAPQVEPELPPIRPEPGAADGLQSLSLKLDYPKLEISEDRAYIPLFFTILGDYPGAMDITVRARFVDGTATPGKDFDMGCQHRSETRGKLPV